MTSSTSLIPFHLIGMWKFRTFSFLFSLSSSLRECFPPASIYILIQYNCSLFIYIFIHIFIYICRMFCSLLLTCVYAYCLFTQREREGRTRNKRQCLHWVSSSSAATPTYAINGGVCLFVAIAPRFKRLFGCPFPLPCALSRARRAATRHPRFLLPERGPHKKKESGLKNA